MSLNLGVYDPILGHRIAGAYPNLCLVKGVFTLDGSTITGLFMIVISTEYTQHVVRVTQRQRFVFFISITASIPAEIKQMLVARVSYGETKTH